MWVETGFFSESRHLSLPVQESSYGSPLTPPKRPKRKLPPKRRQERPVAAPKKRRKVHRVDQYSTETRRKKVSSKNLWCKCHFLGTTLFFIFFNFRSSLHALGWDLAAKTFINVLKDPKESSKTRPSLLGAAFFLLQTVCIRESYLYNLFIF